MKVKSPESRDFASIWLQNGFFTCSWLQFGFHFAFTLLSAWKWKKCNGFGLSSDRSQTEAINFLPFLHAGSHMASVGRQNDANMQCAFSRLLQFGFNFASVWLHFGFLRSNAIFIVCLQMASFASTLLQFCFNLASFLEPLINFLSFLRVGSHLASVGSQNEANTKLSTLSLIWLSLKDNLQFKSDTHVS